VIRFAELYQRNRLGQSETCPSPLNLPGIWVR